MFYLSAIIFIAHATVGVYCLYVGEFGGYMLFFLWEFPFFEIMENMYHTGRPFEWPNIVTLIIGASFWSGLFYAAGSAVRKMKGRGMKR